MCFFEILVNWTLALLDLNIEIDSNILKRCFYYGGEKAFTIEISPKMSARVVLSIFPI